MLSQYFSLIALLHVNVRLANVMHKAFYNAGFSIRIEVGGRNVEVGGEGVTRAAGATF